MDQLKKEKAQPLNKNTDREAGEIKASIDQETGETNESTQQNEKDIISRKEEIEDRLVKLKICNHLKLLMRQGIRN